MSKIVFLFQLLSQTIFKPKTPNKKQLSIPFFSQWERPAEVDNYLNGKKLPRTDQRWEKSGANSPLEYEFFSYHMCGTACLKMLLKDKGCDIKIIPIAKQIADYGGYVIKDIHLNDNFRSDPTDIGGLFYQPFTKYLKTKFKLKSDIYYYLSLTKIFNLISDQKYVLASVNPSIRSSNKIDYSGMGGHIVLITGYDLDKELISFHNPSGLYKKSQSNHTIKISLFSHYFAQRGIAIYG
jgi:hypothetical protein